MHFSLLSPVTTITLTLLILPRSASTSPTPVLKTTNTTYFSGQGELSVYLSTSTTALTPSTRLGCIDWDGYLQTDLCATFAANKHYGQLKTGHTGCMMEEASAGNVSFVCRWNCKRDVEEYREVYYKEVNGKKFMCWGEDRCFWTVEKIPNEMERVRISLANEPIAEPALLVVWDECNDANKKGRCIWA